MFQSQYLSDERSKINLKARKRSQERGSIVREQHALEQEVTSFTVHHHCEVPFDPFKPGTSSKKETVALYWLSWPAALSLCDANTWETDRAGHLNFEKQ